TLLMGVMADKEHERMIGMLAPLASHVTTVTPANARSLDAAEVAREFRDRGVEAISYACLEDGVRAAMEEARREGRPLVCLGSLYMYADVKRAVLSALS
ncbi:MAG: bifunctional folylpolyglutamate synthase/dihydrofolate synthase, partial [Clostridia bacterium]|nr:bifunctional folylpolyglutamate synthase/dihydrofolate synthase [Clostridia bacterium]